MKKIEFTPTGDIASELGISDEQLAGYTKKLEKIYVSCDRVSDFIEAVNEQFSDEKHPMDAYIMFLAGQVAEVQRVRNTLFEAVVRIRNLKDTLPKEIIKEVLYDLICEGNLGESDDDEELTLTMPMSKGGEA